MKKALTVLLLFTLFGFSVSCKEKVSEKEVSIDESNQEANVEDKKTLKALSLNLNDLTSKIYEGSEFEFYELLGNDVRGGDVFDSSDEEFSMGGMELVMDKNTKAEYEYVSFSRSELMYFTNGGMKLTNKDGSVVEANTGEFIFIPKGWSGTRLFSGDKLVQKFSVVYYQKDNDKLNAIENALSFTQEDLSQNLYADEEFNFIELLGSQGRGAKPFKSGDEQFAIGGLHFLMDDEFKRDHYYESFVRNELMFFTEGGMKLIDDEGNETEAKTGEFIFIPKGWSGTRIFTGDKAVKKFSAVYYNNSKD